MYKKTHMTPPDSVWTALREQTREKALSMGFVQTGFTTAEPLGASVQAGWRRWREAGRAGAMHYLMRENPRRTHPRDLLPEARSAIVLLAPYSSQPHGAPPPGALRGKVARYAWGRDYHEVLRSRLLELGDWLTQAATQAGLDTPIVHRPCVDSAPLDERAMAVRAGLGFTGKNTLLLNPEWGSLFLIAVLLTSLEFPPDPPLRESSRTSGTPMPSCGSCRRCLEACPTGAFDDAFRLDPGKCISYLTIEQRDAIPPELARNMAGWVFGCDACQEICPFNDRPLAKVMPELAPQAGVGPWFGAPEIDVIPSGKAFQRTYGHTPLARPGLKGLQRNVSTLMEIDGED